MWNNVLCFSAFQVLKASQLPFLTRLHFIAESEHGPIGGDKVDSMVVKPYMAVGPGRPALLAWAGYTRLYSKLTLF